MFGILRDLGFEIVVCDEEALLHFPDHLYARWVARTHAIFVDARDNDREASRG